MKEASTSSNIDSAQQATLAAIVDAYGPEGDGRVRVSFNSRDGIDGGVTGFDSDGSGCISVAFNAKQLNVGSDYTKDQTWAMFVAHEGQHIVDDLAWKKGVKISPDDFEPRGYTSQAYYQQAAKYAWGIDSLWTPAGGINYEKIRLKAQQSRAAARQ